MIRSVAAAVFVTGLAAVLLVLAWPQLFGLQYIPGIAQVVALRALTGVVALVLALLILAGTLSIRSFRRLGSVLVVLLVGFAAVNGAVLGSRGFGGEISASAVTDLGSNAPIGAEVRTSTGLTVLSWNTLGDATGAAAIAKLAMETGADIISLPETTEATSTEVATIMGAAGRPMWAHHVAFGTVAKSRTTSLLTSATLGLYRVDATQGNTKAVPTVIAVPVNGQGPTIIAAHPVAPIPGYFDLWRSDVHWLKGACSGTNIILAGDLNSTVDHYDGLANSPTATIGDCVDGARASGSGAVGTWPTKLPALLGAPIDHVMATPDWMIDSLRVIVDRDSSGSDHRPIVARLTPRG